MSRLRNNLIFLEEPEEKSGKEKETENPNPISSSPEIIERFNGVASKDIKEAEEKNKKPPESKQ